MPVSMHVLISFIYVTSAPHTSDTHRYYPTLFARHAPCRHFTLIMNPPLGFIIILDGTFSISLILHDLSMPGPSVINEIGRAHV